MGNHFLLKANSSLLRNDLEIHQYILNLESPITSRQILEKLKLREN